MSAQSSLYANYMVHIGSSNRHGSGNIVYGCGSQFCVSQQKLDFFMDIVSDRTENNTFAAKIDKCTHLSTYTTIP